MASPLSASFDYRSQIIENCEFFSSKDDILSVIVINEASGEWKAIVIREDDNDREAFLSSEPCDSSPKAIESLYIKSAEAAAIYIKTNGFNIRPRSKNEDDPSTDDDTASVISARSEESKCAVSVWESSDDEPDTPAPSSLGDRSTKAMKKTRKRNKVQNTQDGLSDSSEDERDEKASNNGSRPSSLRQQSARFPLLPGPPPPPTYRGQGSMPPYQHPPRPVMGMGAPNMPLPHMHRAMPPPPLPLDGLKSMDPMGVQPLYDVRITVRWLYHGEQRVFESTRASLRALRDLTLVYVRSHINAFDNVTPMDHSPSKTWVLRASVKQAFFGTEAYDMSGYRGDDLTKLFNIMGKTDIPRFEIEVDYVRPVGVPPVAGPMTGPGTD